ncbi:restriction endonuclease subunit S [Vibrio parahaemolyticus]|nr:restriction endonuclease subunit S [Vibrio parahaemolyticus]HCG7049918.1 restriction endonuclease subunit S [Vibrio parahaemolyticus]HCH0791731.1 restriction endonuclease subunit S [Vibrio parahaemolyticus]
MTGRYKAYPEYRKSMIEWMDDVPVHWQNTPLKYMAIENNSLFLDGDWIESKDISSDGIRYITTGNVGEGVYKEQGAGFISDETFKKLACTEVFEGDVLLSRLNAPIGRACIVPNLSTRIVTSVDNVIFRPDPHYYKQFLVYLFSSASYFKHTSNLARGATMQRISRGLLGNIRVAIPSLEEQQKIANFLDHETAKIDTLITKQEKLIELLKEKRQAVISHAVTKGLNPDAPMKDSGVEWLGDVPEHWEVLPTKRFFRLVAEPSTKNHGKELLSVYAAIGVAPRKDLEQKGNKASNTDGYWSVKKGDIIVNKLLAWMGAVGYSDYDGVTSPAYDILRKTKDINPKFYHFLFRQEFTQSEFKRWSRGIMEMRLRLYFEELGRIMMPVPPKNEQDKIVAEIESMNATFVKIEDKATKQIELMKERKTALISAAVTGKIDVRDWQESA